MHRMHCFTLFTKGGELKTAVASKKPHVWRKKRKYSRELGERLLLLPWKSGRLLLPRFESRESLKE